MPSKPKGTYNVPVEITKKIEEFRDEFEERIQAARVTGNDRERNRGLRKYEEFRDFVAALAKLATGDLDISNKMTFVRDCDEYAIWVLQIHDWEAPFAQPTGKEIYNCYRIYPTVR